MIQIDIRPLSAPFEASFRPPGSKSLTNRALVVAALARGVSRLDNILLADDSSLMIDAIRSLGVRIDVDPSAHVAIVHGCGGLWPRDEADLFCGNAGTVLRFLTAACCAGRGDYRLDGAARLRQRPVEKLVDALRDLGARIGYEEAEGFCPLTIRASGLRGGTVGFHDPASSQYVSALLLAAPCATSDVMVAVTGALPSAPYTRMSVAVMEAFGVSAVADQQQRFIVPAPQPYRAASYSVEPDASAASYFLAAAALTGSRIHIEGLGTASCQGDVQFVCVLERMGCRAECQPRRTTLTGPADGRLRGIDVDLGSLPDTAPTLAVLAAFADGPTRIRGVANLRIKESDRLAALATELGRLGVSTEMHTDGLTIHPSKEVRGGSVHTYEDHRIAMSFAVAGLRAEGIRIQNPACVNKTFPGYFEELARLGRQTAGR